MSTGKRKHRRKHPQISLARLTRGVGKVQRKRPFKLTVAQRKQLRSLIRDKNRPKRQVERARILLGTNQGFTDSTLAKSLNIQKFKVHRVRKRFAEGGLTAVLMRKQRSSAAAQISAAASQKTLVPDQRNTSSDIDERAVRRLLWQRILSEAGGEQTDWARRHRLTVNYLNRIVLGHQAPSKRVLAVLGLEKVIRYRLRRP